MGQLVTTVVGGALGFLVGGPFGAKVGMMLGGAIGATLFAPTIEGPRLNDLKVSASTYGVAIPEVYGTMRVGGNMIWTTGIRETSEKVGGKGGPSQKQYSYDATFAMALCKGPIDGLLRIWADGKLIYDVTGGSTRNPITFLGSILQVSSSPIVRGIGSLISKDSLKLRIYLGTEEQLPDGLIVADKGADNTSAHRGLAYVVFERMPLEDYGNRIPQLTFEVTRTPSTELPNISTASQNESSPVSGITERTWYPDWELGRLVSYTSADGSNITTFNLNDMKKISSINGIGIGGDRSRLLPGINEFWQETGSTNSRPITVYSSTDFQIVHRLGISSRSVDGFVLTNCDNRNTINYAYGNEVSDEGGAYGALGAVGYCRTSSGVKYLLQGWSNIAYGFSGREVIPDFQVEPGFTADFMIPGSEFRGEAEIIGYKAGSTTTIQIWKWSGSPTFQKVPPEGSCAEPTYEWIGVNPSYAITEIRPFAQALEGDVVLFDPTDRCIFVMGTQGGQTVAAKWSIDTASFKWQKQYTSDVPSPRSSMRYSRLNGGYFGFLYTASRSPNRMIHINLQSGEVERNVDFGDLFGRGAYVGGQQHWDDVSQSLVVETDGDYRRIYFRGGAGLLTVGDVVSDICSRTNVLDALEYDVSALNDDPIVGYLIDQQTSARAVLRQLATAFQFDGYESDFVLKFRSRGSDADVVIPEEDIARNSDMMTVKETLTQELEMPMRISVNFYDVSRDQQKGTQSAKRLAGPVPSMLSSREDVAELPVAWTPTQAKQCADKLLRMSWANRTDFELTLPWKYLKYDPADLATVNMESGATYFMRFADIGVGADFSLQVRAQSDQQTAYDSDAVGSFQEIPYPLIPLTFPSNPLILNTPLLRDIDYDAANNARLYIGVTTQAVEFSGANLLVSDGPDFLPVDTITSKSASGFVESVLPPTTSWATVDEETVLIVRMLDQAVMLESINDEDFLNTDLNAAIVGNEVIRYRDAVLQANGSYHLTGLLRAQRGTNYAVNSHNIEDRFTLLIPANITSFLRPLAQYNQTVTVKSIPVGGSEQDARSVTSNITPRDLQPLTPEDIKISDDGTDVTISAQRRSRVTAPLLDGTGTIPYVEGQKLDGRMRYRVWPDLTFLEIENLPDAPIQGSLSLFDTSGDDVALDFTFALSQLGGNTRALIQITQIGIVEGIPKWIEAERIGQDLWNLTELY